MATITSAIEAYLRGLAAAQAPGTLLPTIAELQQRFGIGGVSTVQAAYQPLIDGGIVVRLDRPRRWAVAGTAAAPSAAQAREEAGIAGLLADAGRHLAEAAEALSRAAALLAAGAAGPASA